MPQEKPVKVYYPKNPHLKLVVYYAFIAVLLILELIYFHGKSDGIARFFTVFNWIFIIFLLFAILLLSLIATSGRHSSVVRIYKDKVELTCPLPGGETITIKRSDVAFVRAERRKGQQLIQIRLKTPKKFALAISNTHSNWTGALLVYLTLKRHRSKVTLGQIFSKDAKVLEKVGEELLRYSEEKYGYHLCLLGSRYAGKYVKGQSLNVLKREANDLLFDMKKALSSLDKKEVVAVKRVEEMRTKKLEKHKVLAHKSRWWLYGLLLVVACVGSYIDLSPSHPGEFFWNIMPGILITVLLVIVMEIARFLVMGIAKLWMRWRQKQ